MPKQPLAPDQDVMLAKFFTDLDYLRDRFKKLTSAPTLDKRIFVLHGVGGVGKTSLLRMFRWHCKETNIPVALASGETAKSAVDVLGNWTKDLKADGVASPTFAKTFDHYRAIQAKASDQAEKIGEKLAKDTAKTITETVLSTIPGIGPVLGKLGGMSLEVLVEWLLSHGFSKPDIDLLLDPTKRLTDDFLVDIEKIAPRRRIVLMLDTFEKMTALEDWTCDLAFRLHANLLLVVAGRGVPNWDRRWMGWLAQADIDEIELMPPAEMRKLVKRYYKTLTDSELDTVQAEGIIEFARGLPIAITSAVNMMVMWKAKDFKSITPKVINDLAKRLQEDVPDELKPALLAAATARWFDEPILRTIMQKTDVSADYDKLQRFPFVVLRDKHFALHDVVRETLDADFRVRDPERHRDSHERAANYFRNLIDNSKLLPGISEDWQKLTLEEVYHFLYANEEVGLDLLSTLFELGVKYLRYQYCHTLIHDAESLQLNNPKSIHRLKHLNIRLDAAEFSWAFIDEKELQALIRESDLDPDTKWDILLSYAWFLGFAGKHNEARQYYEASLEALRAIKKEESVEGCLVLTSLASAYGRIGFVKELALRAIEISQKIDEPLAGYEAYTELGHAYFAQGDHQKAAEIWQKALEIAKKYRNDVRIADAQNKLAQALISLGRLAEAEIVLSSALQSASRLPDTLGGKQDKEMYIKRHLGLWYHAKGDFQKAIQYLCESAQTYRKRRSTNGLLRTIVLLADCYYEANQDTELKALSNEIDIVATKSGMGDWIARWQVLKGHILLDEVSEQVYLLDDAIEMYEKALLSALDWNVQTLDYVGERICWKLAQLFYTNREGAAQSIIKGLTNFWKTEKINDVSLIVIEQAKRKQYEAISGISSGGGVLKKFDTINIRNHKQANFSMWAGL